VLDAERAEGEHEARHAADDRDRRDLSDEEHGAAPVVPGGDDGTRIVNEEF
jgi:hypothetical protein